MAGLVNVLSDLGKAAIGGIVTSNPIGAGIVGIINAFLPEDDKLGTDATAEQTIQKYHSLNSEDQAKVMTSYYEFCSTKVEAQVSMEEQITKRVQEETKRFEQMEITNRNSNTRPRIVWMFSIIIVLVLLALGGSVAYRFAVTGELPSNETSWQFFVILLYIPARVVFKYFDIRTKEKGNQLAALTGGQVSTGSGVMDIFVEREKRKQQQLSNEIEKEKLIRQNVS